MFFFLRLTATLGKFSHAADKIRQKKGKKKRLCKVQFFSVGLYCLWKQSFSECH